MRIVYACYLDPATSDYPLFLAEGWEALGHQVTLVPYDLLYTNDVRASARQRMLCWDASCRLRYFERCLNRICRDARVEVLLLGNLFVSCAGLRRLRATFGCAVGFILGYNHLLQDHTAGMIRAADFVLLHDSYLDPVIRGTQNGKNPNVFHFMGAADPREHRPLELTEADRARYGGDVAFIGGYTEYRASVLAALAAFDLRLWGLDWEKCPHLARCACREPVYGLKKTKIYGAAKIVVNLQEPEKQINSFNSRVPEILACGGFPLTSYQKDTERTPLVEGQSVVSFTSPEELRDKVAHYLDHPTERAAVSREGRRIVLEHLTWAKMAAKLARDFETVVGSRART
ncbi:MAG: glycosyltransferase [Planctomycetes bacterium]|nr:glycosyltransferase [Planctomycetota bacterium]